MIGNKNQLNAQICQQIMGMEPCSVYPDYVHELGAIESVLIRLNLLGWRFYYVRVNTLLAGYDDNIYRAVLANNKISYEAYGDLLDSVLSILAIMIENGEFGGMNE